VRLAATTILFGGGSKETKSQADSDSDARVTACPACHRNFSPDTQFCPYDGERLELQQRQTATRDNLLGSIVDDRYEVLAVIGEGGMGRVYRVRHRRLGRSFALKALRLDLARESVLTERFIQEARAAAVLTHPNVVQINDFGTLASGQPYFVMELLEGRTLTRILREEGPIDPLRCVTIARQIAEALAAAHSMGVIHRDLKPDNVILIRPTGAHMTVKVLDFGLAKVAVSSRLTRPGVVFGTPHYMSPEQASGEPFDHRVDIYALGIMMFEMVTGRVPFEADTYMGVLSKHMYAAPPKPHAFHAPAGGLPGFEEIIAGCLVKNPAERWPSMTDLARKLNALANSSVGASVAAVNGRTPAESHGVIMNVRTAQPLHWYAVAVSVYFMLGIGLLGLVLTKKSSPPPGPMTVSRVKMEDTRKSNPTRAGPVPDGQGTAKPAPAQSAPLVAEAATESAPEANPASAARRPPASKRVRAENKAPRKKGKIPSLGSGDIADPWAK
jgi:eukaryotic-like serine/threonine-protein kinase